VRHLKPNGVALPYLTASTETRAFTAEWAMRFVFDRNGKVTVFRPYDDTAMVTAALR
jgi:hypothetical protein